MQSFTVTALDTAITVDCDPATVPPELVAELQRLWTPCLTPTDSGPTDSGNRVSVRAAIGVQTPIPEGYTSFARGADLRRLANQLSDVITGNALSGLTPAADQVDAATGRLTEVPTQIGVRAAAVARGGRAILLANGLPPGTMQMLAPEFAYLSDAATAIRLSDGTVQGVAKPLTTLETEQWSSRRDVAVADHGITAVTDPVPLAAIVFLQRSRPNTDSPGSESRVESVSIPTAVAGLARQVPIFPALGHPVQDLARVVGLTSGAVRLHYADPSELPALFDAVLSEPVSEPLVIPVDTEVSEGTPRPGDIRRNTMLDGISDGSTMALCAADGTASAVAGLGPYLWDLTQGWISADVLTEQVLAAIGTPVAGDPRALVDAAVADLVEQKILIRLD